MKITFTIEIKKNDPVAPAAATNQAVNPPPAAPTSTLSSPVPDSERGYI